MADPATPTAQHAQPHGPLKRARNVLYAMTRGATLYRVPISEYGVPSSYRKQRVLLRHPRTRPVTIVASRKPPPSGVGRNRG